MSTCVARGGGRGAGREKRRGGERRRGAEDEAAGLARCRETRRVKGRSRWVGVAGAGVGCRGRGE